MGTYESLVTSCSIIACGKIGAKASGPTGSMVAGLRGGSSWKGRSGTRLYQLSGMAFSSRRNFVCSMRISGFCSRQRSAVSLQPFAAPGFLLAGCGSSMHPQPALLSCSSETVTPGDFDQEFVVVADDPVDAEVDEPLHRRRVVDGVRYDLESLGLQLWYGRAVVVEGILPQVPVLRYDRALVGVVHLPVGRDGRCAHAAHERSEVLLGPPVLGRGPRALHARIVVDRAQGTLVGQAAALIGTVLPDQSHRLDARVETA